MPNNKETQKVDFLENLLAMVSILHIRRISKSVGVEITEQEARVLLMGVGLHLLKNEV